ncbi:MAG: nucleotidyltransferase domain-containing protein [Clostridiales bacterium]|nr:nucleotidyltransferase domain-containing protein [Clostridiales bacterium]
MTELRELRIAKKLTQKQVAQNVGISLRSYISYENDERKSRSMKYRFIFQELMKMNVIDESHGILEMEDIVRTCSEVFTDYEIEFCYLFGSYAKGKATETSDVDLLISSTVSGLRFFGLVEKLRERLHKEVDLLDSKQLLTNEQLLNEVLKDGVRIYG